MPHSRITCLVGALSIFASPVTAGAPDTSAPLAATAEQKAQIAPTGELRVAVVMIPFLAKQDPASGKLNGVATDRGEEMAHRLAFRSLRPMRASPRYVRARPISPSWHQRPNAPR
jgi:hypothetical protein